MNRFLEALFRRRGWLFDRDAAEHPRGWSVAEQLMGHRRGDPTTETRYAADPRFEVEAVAERDAELLKRQRRIAVTESRRRRESGVSPFRVRRIS